MSYAKKRLAVFLSMLVVFTTVFCVVPVEHVQAANTISFNWSFYGPNGGTPTLQVQKGASYLYMGDYVRAYNSGTTYTNYGFLSNNKNVTYKSSKPSVVSINSSTGKMSAKAYGTATITITFKSHTEKCNIKVVSSSAIKSFKSSYDYPSNKYAETFVKAFGSGVTTKNRYNLLSISKKAGRFYNSGVVGIYDGSNYNYGVYKPVYARAYVLDRKLDSYADKINPFATNSSKVFNIQKLSGSKKTITATLKSKLTEDQIFGVQYAKEWDTEVKKVSTADFPIYVLDTTTNHRYYAIATVTKGSNKMTIKTKNLTLKKNRTYELVEYNSLSYNKGWLEASKVSKFKSK